MCSHICSAYSSYMLESPSQSVKDEELSLSLSLYVCMYIYMYIYTYVYTYIYIYIYIYIHKIMIIQILII